MFHLPGNAGAAKRALEENPMTEDMRNSEI
jgi:hypothetical protein